MLNIIQDQVKRISIQHGGRQSLKDISIVVFEEGLSSNARRRSYHPSTTSQNTCTIGTMDEIQLHYVGFKRDIDNAILDTKAFVHQNKDEKIINDIGNIVQTHWSEVVKLSSQLLIEFSSSGSMTVKGLKDDVSNFMLKFKDLQRLQMSCALDESKKKLVTEISQNVQWWYFSIDAWVKYDEVINGDMELAYRQDVTAKFYITINGEDYFVDFSSLAKQSCSTDEWFDLERTTCNDESSGKGSNNHSIICQNSNFLNSTFNLKNIRICMAQRFEFFQIRRYRKVKTKFTLSVFVWSIW